MRRRIIHAISCAACLFASSAFPAVADSQTTELQSCMSFENFQQRTEWWRQEYGLNLTIGGLLVKPQDNDTIRIGQLFLMLRELQKSQRNDYQKHLALEFELFSLLNKTHENDPESLFGVLKRSTLSELGIDNIGFFDLRTCAFECPSSTDGKLSQLFTNCLEERQ